MKSNEMLLPSNNTTISESARTVFSVIREKRDMFVFGGAIVEIQTRNGQHSLAQINPEAFRSRIERYGQKPMAYVAYSDDFILKDKNCSMDNARALMASTEARELLPNIKNISECPILSKDLNELGKGYHEVEGVLVTHGKEPVAVDIDEAVESLKKLLTDNSFVTESDRSRALAMMIVPMLKMGGHITGPCPMDVAEADKSQAGKTYRQKVIAGIYNSTPLLVTQKNGGVGSVDESVGSALATGRPFVLLDNFRGNFNSPMLEAIITTPESVPVRLVRRAEQIIDARTVSIQLSSNGVDTTPDMANRSCIIRIRKQTGKQWTTWPEGDLLAHVKAKQHYYLGCVFSIIRAWVEAGKPKTDTTEHDMREWAQSMDWIVQKIFMCKPLLDGHQAIQKAVSSPQLTWLREVCIRADEDGKLDFDLLAHNIAELCEHADIKYPNRRTYQGDEANKYIGVIMAKIFDGQGSVDCDSYVVTRIERECYHENIQRHKLAKIYVISLKN